MACTALQIRLSLSWSAGPIAGLQVVNSQDSFL